MTWDLRFPCTTIRNCLRDRVISLSLGQGGSDFRFAGPCCAWSHKTHQHIYVWWRYGGARLNGGGGHNIVEYCKGVFKVLNSQHDLY